jgi:heme exporter protein A
LLQISDLAVFRGERCLFSGLNFSLAAGQVLQLHGENGSGKTSLLRALCTLLPVEQGTIAWRGEALPASRDQYLSEMCYVGHSEAIKGDLTPRENLAFTAALLQSDHAIEQAAETVGLTQQIDLPCRYLSAGQRRRVALARLLISEAVLWLLDEPLTALDVHGRQLVAQLITDHANNRGAVMFTTHQPLELADAQVLTLDLDNPDLHVPIADDHTLCSQYDD